MKPRPRHAAKLLVGILALGIAAPATAGGVNFVGPPAGFQTGYRCPPGAYYCPPRANYGFGYPLGVFAYPSFIGGGGGYSDPPVVNITNNIVQQPPPVTAPGPVDRAPALLPPPTRIPRDDVALIDVTVPLDAELFIQGVAMKQTGTTRRFVSPTLEAGENYEYKLRARWKENGKEVTANRTLSVRAGDKQSVSLVTKATPDATARSQP